MGPRRSNDTWQSGQEIAELQTLVVTESDRGSDVGIGLLRFAMKEIANHDIAETIVASVASNQVATRFYERAGFTPYLVYFYSRRGGSQS